MIFKELLPKISGLKVYNLNSADCRGNLLYACRIGNHEASACNAACSLT